MTRLALAALALLGVNHLLSWLVRHFGLEPGDISPR